MKTQSLSKICAVTTIFFLAPLAFAEVAPRVSQSADQLRQAQSTQLSAEGFVQALREKVRAKKEVISQTKSLKSRLLCDQMKEQKTLDRDRGASAEAQEARKKIIQDKSIRIQAASQFIEARSAELNDLQQQLKNAESHLNLAKKDRKAARLNLRAVADAEREAQDCAERSLLRKIGGSIGSLFDKMGDIARSRAERDEHEVQKLMKRAYCDPASAVSERRQPKERETLASIPRAIPVSADELSANSAR